MQLHPSWIFQFWTDIDREPPLPGMQKQLISNFSFSSLGNCFFDSINFGEKSTILAYEILFKNGGIYVDHDLLPLKAFDDLVSQLDFFCGLEKPKKTVLSSSVIPGTQLMASIPNHPVIGAAMQWLDSHWELINNSYPGHSRVDSRNRVLHGAYSALSYGIEEGVNREGHRDLVFPSPYFNEKNRKAFSYALHLQDEKWIPVMPLEHKIDHEFQKISHENDLVKLSLLVSAATIFLLIFSVIFKRKEVIFLMIFCIPLSGFSEGDEFSHLMGKGTKYWTFAENSQDAIQLEKFQKLYEKKQAASFYKQWQL